MFVLQEEVSIAILSEYYRGYTFQVQYETYPGVSNDIREAKKYKSIHNAEKSRDSLARKTGRLFEIVELEEK